MAEVLTGLESVPWHELKHNYGTAEDVPELLRTIAASSAAGDRDATAEAADELSNLLYHQGGWVCPAATAAVPFLLRVAADPAAAGRVEVLDVVVALASEATTVEPRFVDRRWRPMWQRRRAEVLALAADPVPAIRRTAVYLVAHDGGPAEESAALLRERLRVEEDRAARLDVVLSLGAVGEDAEALRELLAGGGAPGAAPDLQMRMAAAHALARTDPGVAHDHLPLLVEALRDDGIGVWRDTSWVEGGADAMLVRACGLYPDDDPAARIRFLCALGADNPDPDLRTAFLTEAGRLVSRRRSPVGPLLPLIAGRLGDPEPEVRYRAAAVLGGIGAAAAPYADGPAALLDDDAPAGVGKRHLVCDMALWALARTGDRRCVPALAARLTGPRLGFAHTAAYTENTFYHVELPSLQEVLKPPARYAEELLPALLHRFRTTGDDDLRGALCEVLEAWADGGEDGADASAAVPDLTAAVPDLVRIVRRGCGHRGDGGGGGEGGDGGGGGGGGGDGGARGEGRACACGGPCPGAAERLLPRALEALGALLATERGRAAVAAAPSGPEQGLAADLLGYMGCAGPPPVSGPLGEPVRRAAAWAHYHLTGDPAPARGVLAAALHDRFGDFRSVVRLGELGPCDPATLRRLRELVGDVRSGSGGPPEPGPARGGWSRTSAAYALWRLAGTPDAARAAVHALTDELRPLATGRMEPFMLPALRHLARIAADPHPATRAALQDAGVVPFLRAAPAQDRRLSCWGGVRAFTQDEAVRAALAQALTAATGAVG